MVLDEEIHHECIFPVQGMILALRVYEPEVFPVQGVTLALRAYGPSGSTSDGPLTLCGLKGSYETSSTLALSAVA